jgi:hypothetical protein
VWSNAENDAAADAKVVAVTLELVVSDVLVVGGFLIVEGTLTYGATRHGSSDVVIGVPALLWFDIKIPTEKYIEMRAFNINYIK